MRLPLRVSSLVSKRIPIQRILFCKPLSHIQNHTYTRNLTTMADLTSALADKLKSLDLEKPLPKYPNCYPEFNQTDIYRAHLTEILTEVTGVDAAIIYPALQWTLTLEKGDLVLPVPALRIKGKKPNELAEEWASKVSRLMDCAST